MLKGLQPYIIIIDSTRMRTARTRAAVADRHKDPAAAGSLSSEEAS